MTDISSDDAALAVQADDGGRVVEGSLDDAYRDLTRAFGELHDAEALLAEAVELAEVTKTAIADALFGKYGLRYRSFDESSGPLNLERHSKRISAFLARVKGADANDERTNDE